MWLKPGYEPDRPKPPPDDGERLATFQRGQDQEMRVTLAEYQGHPYINFRVWSPDPQTGELWPARGKGCSIRMAELPELVEALRKAAGTPQGPARAVDDRRDDGSPVRRREPRQGRPDRSAKREWSGQGPRGSDRREFNEF
jgi:hypothetical protein